ncbi:hypothetical protein MNV49_002879 [Pseudohyphozyma bogoriensis]|nr:hypothetical protein MNV49_002879 [Pseudohyphozyma bogoriensis]
MVVPAAEPSLKALGKRRLVPLPLDDAALAAVDDAGASTASALSEAPAVKKLKTEDQSGKSEKRVTRSSLGGPGEGELAGAAGGLLAPGGLPGKTPLLFTLQLPPDVTEHLPPADEAPPPAPPPPLGEGAAPTPPPVLAFRLLGVGDSFERSRHAGASEIDTSDAYYHRLHRFPEVLEKRSARLERDRLIHERAKLITELEELRGRGWVYQGAQGGRGEQERRRRIKEGEERLKRYDYLLPNQPRKSGMLNLGSHPPASGASASDSRANSPALVAPSSRRDGVRGSTPLSASGDGGTTIRIKFGGGMKGGATGSGNAKAGPSATRHGSASGAGKGATRGGVGKEGQGEGEEDADGEHAEQEGEAVRPYSHRKRDRKAERARAAERIRLGLPPRSKLEDFVPGGKGKEKALDSDDDDDADEMEVDELSTGGKEDRVTPKASTPRVNKRLLKDTFFDSEALRASVMDGPNAKGRRSSGRVCWAFGQRVLDSQFPTKEFELYGGISGDESDADHPRLEELLRRRQHGETSSPRARRRSVVRNGVAIPESHAAQSSRFELGYSYYP